MKTIEEEWQEFVRLASHEPQISDAQWAELKSAFFGGAFTMYLLLAELTEAHLSVEEHKAAVDSYRDEVESFSNSQVSQ